MLEILEKTAGVEAFSYQWGIGHCNLIQKLSSLILLVLLIQSAHQVDDPSLSYSRESSESTVNKQDRSTETKVVFPDPVGPVNTVSPSLSYSRESSKSTANKQDRSL